MTSGKDVSGVAGGLPADALYQAKAGEWVKSTGAEPRAKPARRARTPRTFILNLPTWILADDGWAALGPVQRFALYVIAWRCDDPTTHPGNGGHLLNCRLGQDLVDEIGCSPATLWRAVAEFERLGFLVTIARGGGQTKDGAIANTVGVPATRGALDHLAVERRASRNGKGGTPPAKWDGGGGRRTKRSNTDRPAADPSHRETHPVAHGDGPRRTVRRSPSQGDTLPYPDHTHDQTPPPAGGGPEAGGGPGRDDDKLDRQVAWFVDRYQGKDARASSRLRGDYRQLIVDFGTDRAKALCDDAARQADVKNVPRLARYYADQPAAGARPAEQGDGNGMDNPRAMTPEELEWLFGDDDDDRGDRTPAAGVPCAPVSTASRPSPPCDDVEQDDLLELIDLGFPPTDAIDLVDSYKPFVIRGAIDAARGRPDRRTAVLAHLAVVCDAREAA